MPAPMLFVGLHYWAGAGREFTEVARLLAPDFCLRSPRPFGTKMEGVSN
ncbi:hypothetical protein [Hymenobacter roseosalivarius]|nr:hypothetical protein [Hymenobacter roseosalivarius]